MRSVDRPIRAQKQDCYPCLREGDALDEAIAAASRRAPPTP
jgi:hypothetical protein